MKLCIRQKVFSWTDRFTVTDEFGEPHFYVEGELFSWGKKLHLTDLNGNELAFVRQKVFSFLPRFFVDVDGQELCEIVKEFTFFKPRYSVVGLDWEVQGDFWDHDYEITHNGMPVVTINKQWFSWGDCYLLDIADSADVVPALAVVLAIDAAIEQQNNNN